MNKLLSIFFLTLMSGCSTLIGTNELLVQDETRTPVDIQRIKDASWFDQSKHSVSRVSIEHDDNMIMILIMLLSTLVGTPFEFRMLVWDCLEDLRS